MKALKTVAVALGIDPGGADRDPARGAGRTLRLAEGHRGRRRRDPRARPGRLIGIDPVVATNQTPADKAGVELSGPDGPDEARAADRDPRDDPSRPLAGRVRRAGHHGLLAGQLGRGKGAIGILPPSGSWFPPLFHRRFGHAARPAPLARGSDRLPRGDVVPIVALASSASAATRSGSRPSHSRRSRP